MTNFRPETYRILAVDDSALILRQVGTALEQAGFQVLTASSGEESLDLIKQQGLPHLAIVDINLPGMDGFDFCRAVHEFSDLPIIMLTAVDEEDTIVQTIEQFAEDYMTKPFNAGELVARVRRVLRRMGHFAYELSHLTQVDEQLAVDFMGCQAILGEETIPLTPTETKLLYILMRSAGRTVTIDYLLRRLWPQEPAYEDRLRVYVHRLRNKIEATPTKPRYIFSQRGKGYTFRSTYQASPDE
jgi:DNA-binding response OmpR family regulator